MQYGHTVKVKYLSPTDTKGARWSAQLTKSGMNEDTHPRVIVSAHSHHAGDAAKAAMVETFGDDFDGREAFAYGSLSASEYVFIF